MLHKNIKNNGFTLMEILVSISIVTLISTIFLANYHALNRQALLNAATRQLVSDIRLIQSYTMGLKELNGSFPVGGWGITFTAGGQNYSFCADKNENKSCFDMFLGNYDAGELYKEVDMPQNIVVANVLCSEANNICDCNQSNPSQHSYGEAEIIFVPPEPKVIIDKTVSDGVVCANLCVVVQDNLNNAKKCVQVNQFGMVDIHSI